MQRRAQNWALISSALIAFIVVFASVVFAATKHIWFDGILPDNKALFWTNVAVATGTLALAAVTVVSVLQTRALIGGEDRRHQQGFYPLVEFAEERTKSLAHGIHFHNLGKAVARRIHLECGGYWIEDFYSEIERDGSPVMSVTSQQKHRFKEQYNVPALMEGKDIFVPMTRYMANTFITSTHYDRATIQYQDIFGNPYETVYESSDLSRYDWIQPPL